MSRACSCRGAIIIYHSLIKGLCECARDGVRRHLLQLSNCGRRSARFGIGHRGQDYAYERRCCGVYRAVAQRRPTKHRQLLMLPTASGETSMSRRSFRSRTACWPSAALISMIASSLAHSAGPAIVGDLASPCSSTSNVVEHAEGAADRFEVLKVRAVGSAKSAASVRQPHSAKLSACRRRECRY